MVPPCDACRPQTVYSPFVTTHFLLAISLKAISNQRTVDSDSETRGRQFTISSLDTQTHNMFYMAGLYMSMYGMTECSLFRPKVWYDRVFRITSWRPCGRCIRMRL